MQEINLEFLHIENGLKDPKSPSILNKEQKIQLVQVVMSLLDDSKLKIDQIGLVMRFVAVYELDEMSEEDGLLVI